MVTKKILKRFPRLHAAYRSYRESKRLQQMPSQNSMGFWLTGNSAMQSGNFEQAETQLVQSLLKEVDVLINVGANIGYYCCIALSCKKHVVAFEPMPSNLFSLMRNIEINGWEDQIEIFPMALGNHTGVIKIFGAGTGASLIKGWAGQAEDESISVPMTTLDIALGERFSGQRCLILVDVEGAELDMLRGAVRRLSAQPRPIWMVEITVHEHQPAGMQLNPYLLATFELFAQSGYRATTVGECQREIELPEVAEIVRTGIDTLGTHNFLFQAH